MAKRYIGIACAVACAVLLVFLASGCAGNRAAVSVDVRKAVAVSGAIIAARDVKDMVGPIILMTDRTFRENVQANPDAPVMFRKACKEFAGSLNTIEEESLDGSQLGMFTEIRQSWDRFLDTMEKVQEMMANEEYREGQILTDANDPWDQMEVIAKNLETLMTSVDATSAEVKKVKAVHEAIIATLETMDWNGPFILSLDPVFSDYVGMSDDSDILLKRAIEDMGEKLDALAVLLTNEDEKKFMGSIDSGWSEYKEIIDELLELNRNGEKEKAYSISEEKQPMKHLESILDLLNKMMGVIAERHAA